MIRTLAVSLALLALPAAAQFTLDDMIVRDHLDQLQRQNEQILDNQRQAEFQREQYRLQRDLDRQFEEDRRYRAERRREEQDQFDRIYRDLTRRKER